MCSELRSNVLLLSINRFTLYHGLRYAWSIVNCCDMSDPDLYVTKPCGPASCPIMSTSDFPANPFLAKIVNGKCECIAPQMCNN